MPQRKKEDLPTVVEDEDAEYAIIPPDGGWGWVVVIGALYLNTVIDGVFYTFSVILQDLADHFQADKSQISLIFSILFGTHYGMGVVCAGLSSAFGLRPVTCTGALLGAFAFALSSIVPSYPLLYLTYGFMGGIGLGLMITNGVLAPTIYFSRWRGLAIAITSMGTGIGAVLFPYLGNHIRKIATWKTVFQFQAIGIASIFIAGLTFRPIKPTRVVTSIDMEMNITEKRRSKVMSSRSSRSDEPGPLRVPTIYFQKAVYERGKKSTMSLNMPTQVAESLGAKVMYNKLTRGGPRCCDLCTSKNHDDHPQRTESVLFVHPGSKNEIFLEDSPMKIKGRGLMNPDFRKSKIASASSLQPPSFVYSKMEPGAPMKRNVCDPVVESVRSMINCSVFRSPSFTLFVICGVTSVMGLVIVTAYQPDRAEAQGFDSDTATYFVMTFGAANSIWRLFLGVISVLPKSNNLAALVGCTVVGGLASLVSGLNLDLWFQYLWAIGAGLALASFAVHRPVVMVDLVGLDKITPATGIQYMIMGCGAILGPPLSGLVMEKSDNYNAPFYISGTLLTASGFAMSIVGCIHRREEKGKNIDDDLPDFRTSF